MGAYSGTFDLADMPLGIKTLQSTRKWATAFKMGALKTAYMILCTKEWSTIVPLLNKTVFQAIFYADSSVGRVDCWEVVNESTYDFVSWSMTLLG